MKLFTACLLLFTALSSLFSFSAVQADEVISWYQPEAWFEAMKKNTHLSYSGVFEGPSLQNAAKRPDDSALDLLHNFNLSYQFTENTRMGVQVRMTQLFISQANNSSTDQTFQPSSFLMQNMRFYFGASNLAQSGNWKASLLATFDAPTSLSSQNQKLTIAPGLLLPITWRTSSSRWSLWAMTAIRSYLYHGQGNGSGSDLYALMNPYIYYALNSDFSLMAAYAIDFSHRRGTALNLANGSVGKEADVGFTWDFVKGWTLNPYISMNTADLSLKSSAVNVWVSGALL